MPYIGQRPATGEHNSFKILDDISNYTLTFGSSDIDVSADTITAREHRFVTGQRVTYGNGGGTDPTGLSDGTVYYIIVEDRHTFKLATNASNAVAGTAINITAAGAGAAHTINVAFDGVNTKFKATHTNGTKADITQSGQLMVSVNGVLQQPHDNTTTPTTGYATDHTSTIIFSAAPASTDQFFGRLIASNFATFDISDNTVDNFTGDGNTSTFTLSKTPPNNESVLVTIDGVVQYPDDNSAVRAYTVSENVIDFASAPGNGVEIQVRHIGFAGASTAAVSGFYGRTGNAALKSTDNIVFNNATAGIVTATDIRVTGNLTVDGTTTTLDTDLIGVDKLEVAANNTTVAAAITQTGSGDILRLYDGTTQVVTVKDGGNVGIGTNNPEARLHLYSTGPAARWTDSDNNSDSRIRYNGSLFIFEADSFNEIADSAFSFRVDGANIASEKLRITSDGNIGIGTDNPEEELSIQLDSSSDGPTLRLRNANGGDGTYTGRIQTGDAAGTFFAGINFLKHDSNDGEIRFRTKVAGTNTDVVTIVDGNVGVGLTNPTQKLTIAGNTQVENSTFKVVAASPNIILSVPSGGIDSRIYNDGSGNFNIGHGTNSDTPPAKLSITTAGNVGIGSTNPPDKLSIGDEDSYLNDHGIGVYKPHSLGLRNGVFVYNDRSYNATASYRAAAFKAVGVSGNALGISTDAGSSGLGGTQNAYIKFDGSAYFGGDVGINSTSPREKLDIGAGRIILDQDYQFTWANGTTNRVRIYGDSGNNFVVENGSSNTERFRITSNGAVGIGTNSPDDRLHVLGGNIAIGKTEESGYETLISNNSLIFNRNAASYIDQAGTGDIRFRYGANDATWMHMEGANGRIGIGTDIPTSDLHVFRSTSTSSIIDAAAGDALLTLTNAGDGNWSGIDFRRERSTGTNVTGGSIWMPSDTGNNSATLYLQTQSASADAGEDGALTDNNGVRLKLASQPGGSGPNSAFTVEVGSKERLRVDSSGRVSLNDNTRSAGDANEGAQLRVTGAPITRNQYYSPAGDYFGSFGYTDNTYTKSWIAVDSSYNKTSAVSSGIFLSAFHADAGGSSCGHTIKNTRTDAGGLIFSSVVTASSTNNPAVETERLRITSAGNIVTQGLTDKSFSNDGNAKILEITGDGSADNYGVLNLSGNRNQGLPAGVIKFINRENSNTTSASNANSRQIATIDAYVKTSDSNAGDDSGGFLRFVTKEEGGGNAERFRIEAAGINMPTAGKMVFGATQATGSPGSGGFTAYTHADKTTTSLSNLYHYIYRLTTTGTGTDTGACYIVWYYRGNSTWQATLVNREGSNSNHPLLRINGSTVEIYTNHANSYSIRYTCERYEAGDDDARPHSLGPNFQWTRDSDDIYYNPGPWSSELFRIYGTGQIATNGVRNIYETFRLTNNVAYEFDYTVPDEGGYGNSFRIEAGYNHYYAATYGAHRTAWVSTRGTNLAVMLDQNQNTSQAGGWSFSKPNSTTLRLTKSAGTYSGSGYGFLHIRYNHF